LVFILTSLLVVIGILLDIVILMYFKSVLNKFCSVMFCSVPKEFVLNRYVNDHECMSSAPLSRSEFGNAYLTESTIIEKCMQATVGFEVTKFING